MKKVLFQASLLISTALIFGASAHAQYRVQIPFDFDAANVHFTAGEYVLGPLSTNTGASSLAIRDVETGRTKLAGLTSLTGDDRQGRSKLIFNKIGNRYTLSEIVTGRFSYRGPSPKEYSHVAKTTATKSEVVSVELH